MNHGDNRRGGFTLIELMLAMTFVAILLLVIAMTVIQISNIYNKGLTMKAVDQAGRTISADIQETLSESPPFSLDAAFHLQHASDNGSSSYDGGRLCTGSYSYIWNDGESLVNTYSSGTDVIRFVRVRDSGGQYCTDLGKQVKESDATELLSASDGDLAVQSFAITQLASDPTIGQALYRIVMEIGTNSKDALQQTQTVDTIDTRCKPPSDSESLQNFCAVNQFDFTVRAGNKGGQ